MTKDELYRKEHLLNEKYLEDLHNLRKSYVEPNARYKVGEFIRGLTGIIKIEDISYQYIDGDIQIIYCGYKYEYRDRVLQQVLKKDQVCISEDPSNLFLISNK